MPEVELVNEPEGGLDVEISEIVLSPSCPPLHQLLGMEVALWKFGEMCLESAPFVLKALTPDH